MGHGPHSSGTSSRAQPASPVNRARGGAPQARREGWWFRLWQPFWALPVAIVLLALASGLLIPEVDRGLGDHVPFVFRGGPEGARGMLSTIATAMISVTGLVFSITMVVLQLASSQFTPRVLGSFLGSRVTQATLGVFTASFVFALSVLRSVRGTSGERDAFVPQLSVTVAFLLVLASVGLFLAFIHHITTSIQVSETISRVGDDTMDAIDAIYPNLKDEDRQAPVAGPTWSPRPGASRTTVSASGRHGHLTSVDYAALVGWAADHAAVVTVDREVGEFVAEGQELAQIWAEDLDPAAVRAVDPMLRLASTRTLRQEVGFGLRQLVDIAERALSPGINDPTTATQVVHELHRLLRSLVQRESPSPYVADEQGQVRVVHHPQSVDALLELAVVEIAHYGKGSLQVPQVLAAMLEDLRTCTLPPYLRTIEGLLEQVRTSSPAVPGPDS